MNIPYHQGFQSVSSWLFLQRSEFPQTSGYHPYTMHRVQKQTKTCGQDQHKPYAGLPSLHWLQKAGLDVQSEHIEIPPVRSLGPGSKLEVSGTSLDFSYLALDLSTAKAGDKYILNDDHAVILTGEKTENAKTSGHIVLVEAASSEEFRKSLKNVLKDDPLAVVGVNPGTLPEEIGPVGLSLDVMEIIPGFHSENIWVDIPGTSPEKQDILIAANHGSIGPGAGDNASGAAAAALLARTLKQNPLPVPVRILWAAGGDAQYNGGLALYLDKHTLPKAAVALSRLGSNNPLVFGYREDITYGRPRDINPTGEDLTPEDLIPFVRQQPQHHSGLWDLGYPSVRRRVLAEDQDMLTTPDEWMAAAEKIGKEMNMDFKPAFPLGLGGRLLDAGIPTAPLWRPSPFANTKKDTVDRIIPQTMGKDILFMERILREIAGKGELP
ncbi:M28 family peptidase [Biomaibacter acetigenes]|uniref:M28 family peptidase n=1 Tax=Biomaibacter acetigenes TaxID=2316383 RepID=A0A3G2R3V7_9FIRM|nr:M28 family peptidase [Biomaibacter acetigenes]